MLPSNTWNKNIYNKKVGFIKKNFLRNLTERLKNNFVQFSDYNHMSAAFYRKLYKY